MNKWTNWAQCIYFQGGNWGPENRNSLRSQEHRLKPHLEATLATTPYWQLLFHSGQFRSCFRKTSRETSPCLYKFPASSWLIIPPYILALDPLNEALFNIPFCIIHIWSQRLLYKKYEVFVEKWNANVFRSLMQRSLTFWTRSRHLPSVFVVLMQFANVSQAHSRISTDLLNIIEFSGSWATRQTGG